MQVGDEGGEDVSFACCHEETHPAAAGDVAIACDVVAAPVVCARRDEVVQFSRGNQQRAVHPDAPVFPQQHHAEDVREVRQVDDASTLFLQHVVRHGDIVRKVVLCDENDRVSTGTALHGSIARLHNGRHLFLSLPPASPDGRVGGEWFTRFGSRLGRVVVEEFASAAGVHQIGEDAALFQA